MQRDPATFKQRVRKWMFAVVASITSVPHSSVEQFCRRACSDTWACLEAPERVSDDCRVPPLPFGPNEQRHMCADGGLETATAEETGGSQAQGIALCFSIALMSKATRRGQKLNVRICRCETRRVRSSTKRNGPRSLQLRKKISGVSPSLLPHVELCQLTVCLRNCAHQSPS